jgi:uncharacterized membrane protein
MKTIGRFAGAIAILIALAVPASAQVSGEHIAAYDVTIVIQPNGTLAVTEAILYDFGDTAHHGIFRDLVDHETYNAHEDRRYEISNIHVTASAASAQTQTTHQGPFLHIRIGDPNNTVTGQHLYTITYDVKGAPLTFPDHDELYWDAIGNQWPVPISRATVLVRAPAKVTKVACYAGPQGSRLACDSAQSSGKSARFTDAFLTSYSGLTIVVAIPKGTIQPAPQPILARRRTLGDAFALRPNTLVPAGVLAVLGIVAIVWLVLRRGRDRRFTGSAVDAAFGNATGDEQAVPVRTASGPVEFVPPDNIRPGEVGTLIDEHANVIDVTATIIDLAVRGWLTITEHDHDYTLAATQNAGKGTLLPYETQLMADLFASGPSVELSELKYHFRDEMQAVQSALYDDTVTQGWYRMRPDRTRMQWGAIGIGVVIVGAIATFVTAKASSFGIVPIAIVVVGIVLMAFSGRMPSRTGKGTAMLSRVRGFRRLFDEGEEDTRARFAEQHNIFSEYLPYAIVFGCATKWAKAFSGLTAEELATTQWYTGPSALDAFVFATAIDQFSTVATGTLYASMPSSSGGSGFGGGFGGFGGGFAGGGGGGGGGGSW